MRDRSAESANKPILDGYFSVIRRVLEDEEIFVWT